MNRTLAHYFLFVLLFINLGWIHSQKIQLELIPYRDGDKWGYQEFNGEMRIQPKYDTTTFFTNINNKHSSGGLVKLNNKWGMISPNDTQIIPLIYDKLELISQGSDSLLIATLNGKCGIINQDNKTIVPFKYKWIQEDSEYHQQSNLDPEFRFIGLKKNNKMYYILPNGKEILKAEKKPSQGALQELVLSEWEGVAGDNEAFSTHQVDDTPRIYKPNADSLKKYGIDSISSFPFNPIYYFLYKNGKKGVSRCEALFGQDDLLLPPQFDELINYKDVQFVVKRNDSIAVLEFPNLVSMPYSKLDKVQLGEDYFDLIITEKNKTFGFYSSYAQKEIEPIYDQIIEFNVDGTKFFLVTKNGKDGWMSKDLVEYFKN